MRLTIALLAAAGLVLATACSGAIDASTTTPSPTLTAAPPIGRIATPSECRPGMRISEAEAIAQEFLSARTDAPIFDRAEWDSTVARASEVLNLARSAFPGPMRWSPEHASALAVHIGLSGPFGRQVLAEASLGEGSLTTAHTGDEELDALNATFDLKAMVVTWVRQTGLVGADLCLDPLANAAAAIKAYRKLSSVVSASQLYTGSGEASGLAVGERDGDWFIVSYEAHGDCPSGCIFQLLAFFRVTGTEVAQLTGEEAASDPLVVALTTRIRHSDRPWPYVLATATPSPTPSVTPAILPRTGGPTRALSRGTIR